MARLKLASQTVFEWLINVGDLAGSPAGESMLMYTPIEGFDSGSE
jgi:hypothetical protein